MTRRRINKPRRKPALVESLEPRNMLNGDFRSIDGSGNNEEHPEWGSAGTQLMRLTSPAYADGVSEPAAGADGSGRPNPREISNRVVRQTESIINDRGLTGFVFQWGQFLDHDMDLTEEAIPVETFMVSIPENDPSMTADMPIPLFRSRFDPQTGTDSSNPRQQINQITSYIDASNVYGSDAQRAAALRSGLGGQLQTSEGNLLPFNEAGLHNAAPGPDPTAFFLAGDVRANEQPGLTALHTLFVREHNWWATEIAARDFVGQDLSSPEIDEAIYQQARRIVAAEIQSITYNEFLPALLGPDQLPSFSGYDDSVNASIANIFSAALYRVGHTMLPSELPRLDDAGDPLPEGAIPLNDAFFLPELTIDYGIEPYLKGLSELNIQEIDAHVMDSVRDMLFDPPAQFDLASINMQRGRDHGLPDYNSARRQLGLPPARGFRDITSDRDTARAIRKAYDGDIDNIDVWLGGISEDHVPGGSVGSLVHHVLVDQFTRLRDGDRYFYEHGFSGPELYQIQDTRLSDVILRNTSLTSLRDELFRDSSVLTFRAAAEGDGVDVTARLVGKQRIEIVDNRDGRVLAEGDRRSTSKVVLFGSDGDDRLVIDGSLARLHDVSVEVHADGGTDELVVNGSSRSERIMVERSSVRINHHHVYFGNVEMVRVGGGSGNDLLRVRDVMDAMVLLDGGDGNDRVIGGSGGEILLGGQGNDVLFGGRGDDLMIGGEGRDRMSGRGGHDVLLHGTTSFDDDSRALRSILAEWHSDRGYDQRADNLLGNSDGPRENGDCFLIMDETVIEDHAVDKLMGDAGWDLFLAGARDRPHGMRSGERLNV